MKPKKLLDRLPMGPHEVRSEFGCAEAGTAGIAPS